MSAHFYSDDCQTIQQCQLLSAPCHPASREQLLRHGWLAECVRADSSSSSAKLSLFGVVPSSCYRRSPYVISQLVPRPCAQLTQLLRTRRCPRCSYIILSIRILPVTSAVDHSPMTNVFLSSPSSLVASPCNCLLFGISDGLNRRLHSSQNATPDFWLTHCIVTSSHLTYVCCTDHAPVCYHNICNVAVLV